MTARGALSTLAMSNALRTRKPRKEMRTASASQGASRNVSAAAFGHGPADDMPVQARYRLCSLGCDQGVGYLSNVSLLGTGKREVESQDEANEFRINNSDGFEHGQTSWLASWHLINLRQACACSKLHYAASENPDRSCAKKGEGSVVLGQSLL